MYGGSGKAVPFRKLPVLEADGVVIHQSLAISRYLARETGLAGETALEQAQADAIVDTINDFIVMFPWSEADKAVKQKLQDDLFTNVAPELLDHLENFLGDRLWFAGKSDSSCEVSIARMSAESGGLPCGQGDIEVDFSGTNNGMDLTKELDLAKDMMILEPSNSLQKTEEPPVRQEPVREGNVVDNMKHISVSQDGGGLTSQVVTPRVGRK
nr:PREDICTED: hematopoietic prostaglandin D synthase [Latimeria chalumnae]|eukprot:XP_014354090.1 PREDICTED: hematopoietic prostaglandin D synthase [Latimeria chalumnae]